MKKVEYVFMGLTAICALFGIFVNFNNGVTSYIWNINTIMWVLVCFMKMREVNSLERKLDQNSKS